MRVRVIAVGRRSPGWAKAATDEYVQRLPRELNFEWVEIPAARSGSPARRVAVEADRIRHLARRCELIALDERGQSMRTVQWAQAMSRWRQTGTDAALVIGGAEGLDGGLLRAARERWSLSALTLPHAVVRVIVVEQLYRAATLLGGHPYHRH